MPIEGNRQHANQAAGLRKQACVAELQSAYSNAPKVSVYGAVKMVVTPWSDMDQVITTAAWGWVDPMDGPEVDRILAFRREHIDRAPEDAFSSRVTWVFNCSKNLRDEQVSSMPPRICSSGIARGCAPVLDCRRPRTLDKQCCGRSRTSTRSLLSRDTAAPGQLRYPGLDFGCGTPRHRQQLV